MALVYYFTIPDVLPFTLNHTPLATVDIVNTVAISIVMGLIFSRKKGLIERVKLEAMRSLAGNIAHELRTPLASIGGAVEGMKRYLPRLVGGYNLAKDAGLAVEPIRTDHQHILSTLLEELGNEVRFSNTIIDMLLIKLNPYFQETYFERCSIKECVEDAITRYPFDFESQRTLVHCSIVENFTFRGEKLLLVHVLFNLLKNSLYFIREAKKGEIYIWSGVSKEENILYFKDTAKGVNANIYPELFKWFFTSTYNGTGLGLAFCKFVMERLKGSIAYETKEGEYIQFMLKFPPY